MGLWKDEEDEEIGGIHGGVMKNRFGRATGITQFSIDYNTLILSEAEETPEEDLTAESNSIYDSLREMGQA